MDPKNTILIAYKAQCHGKLGELTSSIESLKLLLELEADNISAVTDLLEMLALGNQIDEFDKIYTKYKAVVDERDGGNLSVYLKALLALINGNLSEAITDLNKFIDRYPNAEANPKLGGWKFDEAMAIISKLPDTKQKNLLLNTIKFFEGKITSDIFKTHLQDQK